jgi:uncharacterized protein
MNCPRCANVILEERERDSLLVDVCAVCRGVWLDRGELEKLIARASREFDEFSARRHDTPARGVRSADDRHRDDHDLDGRYPKRKRGWIDSLGELFD